ncbi:hypothetical protein ACFV3R_18765 [Streptomyces sp. NPDC059740]|uniref:hypothetical protein n=1 Tax=Streptomyces sp. NPDC059740 TaxID=3346926 RepID=UPI00365981AD
MTHLLYTLGDVLGDVVRYTSDVALVAFLAALALLVLAVPVGMVYTVVSSARASRSS